MHYTRRDWYVACAEDDLTEGVPLAVTILDQALVVWRAGDGISVLEDRCVHRAAALSLGRCEGDRLRCMYHGILFDADGKAVEIPGQETIPPNAMVRSYPVTLRHGFVWVWMGDPACTDRRPVPDLFDGIDADDYLTAKGALDFDAAAQLISDNLLDFSHLPFVHGNSFRAPPDWAQSTTKSETLDRGLRFERWIENGEGRHIFDPQPTEPFDDWLGYEYLIPGVLIMWSGIFPGGTARALDHNKPDLAKSTGQLLMNIQMITPTTERTSRYHFMVGVHRAVEGAERIIGPLEEVIVQAFNEDKQMIEAQQRIIDRNPDRPIMPTIHDRAVTIYGRLKARLIAEEAGIPQTGNA